MSKVRSAARRLFAPSLIVIAVSLFVVFVLNQSKEFTECVHTGKKTADYNELEKRSGIFIEAPKIYWLRVRLYTGCAGHFTDKNEGALVAIATIALSIFTFTLWRSTDKLWIAHEQSHRATQRAFVFIEGFDYELTTAADNPTLEVARDLPPRYRGYAYLFITRFAIQPRWKNAGATPTRNMKILMDWRGPLEDVPLNYSYRRPAAPFFIAPQAVEHGEIVEIPSIQAIVDYNMTPEGKEPTFLLWGRADYQDVFGEKHFVEWCYKIRLEAHRGPRERMTAGFIQWGEHNRADDDSY